MVLNRLTPILVAVHVLTIPTSATNVRASSVLQPYHFPSVLQYTVLTHQTNVHASSVLQPYHFPTRRQMYSHIICLHNISSHHNSISCRCNNWKGGRGQFRQKFDHHYSKWVGLLITLTDKDKKENKKKKRFISRD